jgi:hypothetical protein
MFDFSSIHQQLLNEISFKIGDNKKISFEIGDILHLASGAVYKRLNSKQYFSFEEIITLCDHYSISFDSIIAYNTNILQFSHPYLQEKPKSIHTFLQKILSDISLVNKLSNPRIQYISNEIPFFFYLDFPDILAFKLIVWGRTVWNMPEFMRDKVSISKVLDDESRYIIDDIKQAYNQVSTHYYLNTNIFISTISQLQYFRDALIISKSGYVLIKDLLLDMLELNDKKVKVGLKSINENESNVAEYKLYNNELFQASSQILVDSDSVNMLFSIFDNPNFIQSNDKKVCSYTKEWLNNVQNKSILLNQSEKECIKYFNKVRKTFDIFDE